MQKREDGQEDEKSILSLTELLRIRKECRDRVDSTEKTLEGGLLVLFRGRLHRLRQIIVLGMMH